ncbi:NmrA family NAD(P)-binding protein [Prochlorococcus sp. MIT 1307]|uniref:NmrA family NAD(P)-binding protein n=1 Tax=Prochlorococcus sp. MIT 1307 TaxID=3096219 RepID=UPI002A74FF21|nr:NmrA family NAD(P)-binding protein [Prochlorococcus sp. MIT 1307]
MQVLVIGGTGTLGRQIAKTAVDAGYQVRCMVRTPRKAAFLQEWGCEIVQGDLLDPESLEYALQGVDSLIDSATTRPEDPKSVYETDWEGKLNLYRACDRIGVKRVIFMSLFAAEQHRNVPLMDIKYCTERLLSDSSLDYTILQGVAFMQGLISQYAIPVLESQNVWISATPAEIAYMNTQDMARFVVAALERPQTIRKSFPVVGPRAWKAEEVVELCEKACGKAKSSKVLKVSPFLLSTGKALVSFFQDSLNVLDRLAFSEVTGGGAILDAPMEKSYEAFGLDPAKTSTLDAYLREYYSIIMKRMRELDIDVDKEEKKRVPF